MAKFQRFDSRNKKRTKDKFRSEQRDSRLQKEDRAGRNNYNRQHLTQAYQTGRVDLEDSLS